MSRIDELIKQYCPDGAPHETVGAVTQRVSNINWKTASESTFNYIDLSSVNRNRVNSVETSLIDAGNAPSRAQQIVQFGDVLFGTTRPMLKRFAYIGEELDGSVASTGFCVLRANEHRILSRFLFHSVQTLNFMAFIEVNQQGASYPSISDALVRNYVLPVPPIEVQREIVDILDKFTQLEAELEAELEARRKQYEYYRNELLSFKNVEGGVRTMSIGEMEDLHLLKLGRGNVISRGDLLQEPGDYPVYSSSATNNGEFGRYGRFMFEDERITWSIDGGGKFFHRPAHRYSVTNVCGWLVIQDESVLLAKYVYYALLNAWATKTYDYTVKAHPSVIRNDYVLPVPPIDVQQEVVAALDCLEALVHDISIGLPGEIEARRKQYEFYRDRLLSFQELDVA